MKTLSSKWSLISIFLAVLFSVSGAWTSNCIAAPAGFRIIANINDGGAHKTERMIARHIQRFSEGTGQIIDLQRAPSFIWFPGVSENPSFDLTGGYVIVQDKKLPPVSASVKTSQAEEIEVSGQKFLKRSFIIKGEAGESDLTFTSEGESSDSGIRSITVEGDGYAVLSASDSSLQTGRVRLTMRALPALWRTDVSENDLKVEIDAAWTRIP